MEPSVRRVRATSSPEPSGSPMSRMIDLEPSDVLGQLERRAHVGRELHDVPLLLQQAPEEAAESRVVLDDEYVHGRTLPGEPGRRSADAGRPSRSHRHFGTTITLDAVPRANPPPVPGEAFGPPFPPPRVTWTWTVLPVVTSADVAGAWLW